MSREAELYILDEPLGGVDPATIVLTSSADELRTKENASIDEIFMQ